VLFTGEPGTGKTLATEVIAGLIGVRLVTVDLSRVVSK
jgi:SpoVK/Ycf46/Vps4 family AAA+-type ATPase